MRQTRSTCGLKSDQSLNSGERNMRLKTFLPLALLLTPAIVLAQESSDSVVQWNHIVGVITAPGVNNVVAGISSGAGPWSVQKGHARVDLASGQVSFEVRGLVLNGSNSSGTPSSASTRSIIGLYRACRLRPAAMIRFPRSLVK